MWYNEFEENILLFLIKTLYNYIISNFNAVFHSNMSFFFGFLSGG